MSMATEHTITHKDAVAERSPYYARRVELFEKYQARQKDAVEAARAANAPLTVKLPQCDNKTYTEAVRGVTCPIDVAKAVDNVEDDVDELPALVSATRGAMVVVSTAVAAVLAATGADADDVGEA